MGHTLHHDLDPAWLTAGLETLKSHLATTHQPWCLDRVLAPPELLTHSAKSRKRKRKQDRRSNPPSRDPTTSTSPPPPQLTSPLSNPTPLPLLHHTSHPNHTLHLPPNSLSIPSPLPIPHPSPSSLPYTLITLDPPYPNRSATRCTTTYPTHPLSHLPIPTLPLSPSTPTTLLLWTTNATRVRTAALALLAAWNAVLIEEWVWLKITAAGEPVTAVEGAWRKPYEVCLVGRADGDANSYVDSNNEATIPSHEAKPPPSAIAAATAPAAVPKRLLIAVPDLHSRKPAAKTLAEGVLGLQPGEYRGLEVFARGASAGWTAWGDEVGVGMGESWWWEDGNEGGGC
ncbi:hypothetical protein MMC20_000322 [Loxospora ochrophaea]|nr:hypothetical protein [Loxospora ochrophaea]